MMLAARRLVACLLVITVMALSIPERASALAHIDPMLTKAAACLVRKHERVMRSLVVSLPHSTEQQEAWRAAAPALADCINGIAGGLEMGRQELFLGEVAYQLLRSTGSTFRTHWTGEAPAAESLGQSAARLTIGYAPRPAFAPCVVSVYSNEVGERISTSPRSARESDRFNSLIRNASVCLDAGAEVRASPGGLRSDIARALYRHIFMRSIAIRPATLEGSK